MKLYDEVTISKVNNYMLQPKDLTTPKTNKQITDKQVITTPMH